MLRDVAGCCGTLRDVAGRCGTLQDVAGRCGTLQDVAGRCGTLQDVAGVCVLLIGVSATVEIGSTPCPLLRTQGAILFRAFTNLSLAIENQFDTVWSLC